MLQQLANAGIMDRLTYVNLGYLWRRSFNEFMDKFGAVAHANLTQLSGFQPNEKCRYLIDRIKEAHPTVNLGEIHIGKTMVMGNITTGKTMEELRASTMVNCVVTVCNTIRRAGVLKRMKVLREKRNSAREVLERVARELLDHPDSLVDVIDEAIKDCKGVNLQSVEIKLLKEKKEMVRHVSDIVSRMIPCFMAAEQALKPEGSSFINIGSENEIKSDIVADVDEAAKVLADMNNFECFNDHEVKLALHARLERDGDAAEVLRSLRSALKVSNETAIEASLDIATVVMKKTNLASKELAKAHFMLDLLKLERSLLSSYTEAFDAFHL